LARVSEFYGTRVYTHHDGHNPPHFHAFYAGEDVEVLFDADWTIVGDFPRRAGRFVREWAALHRAELAVNWDLARAGAALRRIEGLA
jgi:hypothetical protein